MQGLGLILQRRRVACVACVACVAPSLGAGIFFFVRERPVPKQVIGFELSGDSHCKLRARARSSARGVYLTLLRFVELRCGLPGGVLLGRQSARATHTSRVARGTRVTIRHHFHP